MLVKDLMTTQALSVQPSSKLSDAAHIMWEGDCGALPVIDEVSGRVVGMVTDRDICMACWTRNAAPGDLFASDAMSQHLVHCHPEETIEHAEMVMNANQIRRLPVVDADERLLGILSLADIARAADAAPALSARRNSSADALASTLAGISRSKPPTSPLQAEIAH